MAEEQLDYGDEEFGGSQKMQYHGDGAIPALADDEIGGEDDEYDDLYNDVNVGEGFLQMQRSEALPSTNIGNGGFHDQKVNVQEPRSEAMVSQDINTNTNTNSNTNINMNIPGVANESAYPKEGMTVDLLQKRMAPLPQVSNDVQMGFRGPQKIPVDPVNITNEPPPSMLNSNPGHQMNVTRPVITENQARPPGETGATTLFVGELHWWTTDAELENVLSQYGRVKEIKFFDERASGKSKGYCQVEFHESASAAACKEGMNGYLFNGRPCVVAFASPQTIRQMGAAYANKNQGPVQSQEAGRRPMNDGGGRGAGGGGAGGGGGGANFSGGDSGRNFGRGNWGRGGQGVGRGVGNMRGRGGMGPKNVNAGPGFGYAGPGFAGPPGGFMHPQGMMGGGFDPTYMGRGGGYGGFPGGGFPGMMPNFPGMGIAGVAPHVNPAFFGRGMGGMMGGGGGGMEGPQGGMWGDTGMGGQWGGGGGGEEHGQRTRESSYGGEDGGSEYGYTDTGHEKGAQRSNPGREKERGSEREREREREWSGSSEKRHREERDYEKDYKYKEEKDTNNNHNNNNNNYREHHHRQKEREDDWDRGQSSTRSRSRSRAAPEEDHHRSRSRDADYGKRRRMRSD
ncbi:hypothetical protein Lser_V15G14642 [Lactuca serriola]